MTMMMMTMTMTRMLLLLMMTMLMMMALLWLTVHIVMLVVVLNVPISGLATINPPKCCFRIGWGSAVTRVSLLLQLVFPRSTIGVDLDMLYQDLQL